MVLILVIIIGSCNPRKQTPQWNTVNINPRIARDSIYKQLDKENEIFSALENHAALMKRTSDVAYFSGQKINLQEDKFAKLNNCRATFANSDTLSINIGIGNGFSGKGFIILYKNNKFCAEPYHYTDMVIEGEVEPTYKIIYQKLILDKPTYKPGDSLYGRIEFKCIETKNSSEKEEHFAIGNFRTKVRRS